MSELELHIKKPPGKGSREDSSATAVVHMMRPKGPVTLKVMVYIYIYTL